MRGPVPYDEPGRLRSTGLPRLAFRSAADNSYSRKQNVRLMAAAANDWGIPDWRDARAYGADKNWDENRWRCE